MEPRDTRAPFASIDGVTPATFHALPTPCYLLDEAQLQANAEILGALAERTGCRIPRISRGPRRAASTRRGSAQRRCREKKCMYSVPRTGKMRWQS